MYGVVDPSTWVSYLTPLLNQPLIAFPSSLSLLGASLGLLIFVVNL
jgi:hypothetical protein